MGRRHQRSLTPAETPTALARRASEPPPVAPPEPPVAVALVAIHAGCVYSPGDVIPEAIAAQFTLGREYIR